ncbi:MAG: hypothetical protein QXU98_12505 [Candidatus Parvarchaeota archaeon]
MRFDTFSSVSKSYRCVSKGKRDKFPASANKLLKVISWVLREKRPYSTLTGPPCSFK